jgi:ribosomal protein S18 acetylase RimI-like enzyme
MTIDSRPVGPDDLELICRHREEMFRDAGREDGLSRMTEHFRAWLKPRLADGSYSGFILTDGELPVAGIGMMLIDWPPHPSHPEQDRRGYILNVYVEPAYRRRGLARQMMRLTEAHFAQRGVEYTVLHATDKGRPLYRELGWHPTAEMAKTTPQP